MAVFNSFLGVVIAISFWGIISNWSGNELLVVAYGASTVMLFGAANSPLDQSRNLVDGNILGAVSSTTFVAF